MNWKRWLSIGLIVTLTSLAAGYHLVMGYVSVTRINDTTYLLNRKNLFSQIGANVVVHVSSTGITVVDSQLKPLAAATRLQVQALSNQPISRVFITHWHPDHSGGLAAYSADSEIIAHKNTIAILSQPQKGFGLTSPDSIHEFTARDADVKSAVAVDARLVQENIEAVHYPNAHTGGDLVVYFDGVAAIGDLVWPGSFPFIDIHNGGSTLGLEVALRQIVARSKTTDLFLPGHGSMLTRDELAVYLDMVIETREVVEKQKIEGKSIEEIISVGLADKWQNWSSDLVPESVWITMIFESP